MDGGPHFSLLFLAAARHRRVVDGMLLFVIINENKINTKKTSSELKFLPLPGILRMDGQSALAAKGQQQGFLRPAPSLQCRALWA